MKTVRNTTSRPLKVSLGRGKFLHLGPKKSGNVHPDALERPATKKMLEAGDLELLDDADSRPGGGSSQGGPAQTHGHVPDTGMHRKGDR
jgi:hypothetical protein